VIRRDVHPIRYVSVAVSCRPVPRVSHTEQSRSCLHLQWNFVRPLGLTEELRLCQNIEHYQLSILMSRAQASIQRHDARIPSTKIECA
jgi:hypothetical protein